MDALTSPSGSEARTAHFLLGVTPTPEQSTVKHIAAHTCARALLKQGFSAMLLLRKISIREPRRFAVLTPLRQT